MNYFQCDHIIGDEQSIAKLLDSLSKAYSRHLMVKKHQLFQIEQYVALPAMFAFMKFFKRDYMKINYVSEITGYKYDMRAAETIFNEMKSHLPAKVLAFKNKFNYREDLDFIYSIIQPDIETNFVNEEQRQILEDAIFIMIENGISFAPSTSSAFITNKSGNSRRVLYEPLFEKYMVYGVSIKLTLGRTS